MLQKQAHNQRVVGCVHSQTQRGFVQEVPGGLKVKHLHAASAAGMQNPHKSLRRARPCRPRDLPQRRKPLSGAMRPRHEACFLRRAKWREEARCKGDPTSSYGICTLALACRSVNATSSRCALIAAWRGWTPAPFAMLAHCPSTRQCST